MTTDQALALAATKLANLIDRCQLYGPADAARGAVREVRAALSALAAAPPAAGGADAELGRLVRTMPRDHSLHRWGDSWVVWHPGTQSHPYAARRGEQATPEAALRQALQSAAAQGEGR